MKLHRVAAPLFGANRRKDVDDLGEKQRITQGLDRVVQGSPLGREKAISAFRSVQARWAFSGPQATACPAPAPGAPFLGDGWPEQGPVTAQHRVQDAAVALVTES